MGGLDADLAAPMAIRVAATLRLADLMADGPLGVDELAHRCATDPDAHDLLRFLVSRGLFVEPRSGVFANNEAVAALLTDHPSGMVSWLDLAGQGRVALAFTGLLDSVRTGQPAFASVFGAPLWEYLSANPAVGAAFDASMADVEYKSDAAASYDWGRARHVVDVGGGLGALLAEVLTAHAHLHATLVDLPGPVTRAREYLAARGVSDRCTCVAQSFFDPLPAAGDTYVLSGVLADFPDERAEAIVGGCVRAMGEHGRLVIIEHPAADERRRTHMDLLMLVLLGGRDRTLAELAALAARAGCQVTTPRTTPLGQTIIECTHQIPEMTTQTIPAIRSVP
ncbi:MAG: methyltransferase [Mycobacteriales bacterium]